MISANPWRTLRSVEFVETASRRPAMTCRGSPIRAAGAIRRMPLPDPDTVTVAATVLGLKCVDAGRLLALAEVELEIAGIVFTLRGVRVIKTGPRSHGVAAPCYRGANGRLADAISLPPELAQAVAGVVLDEYEAISDHG